MPFASDSYYMLIVLRIGRILIHHTGSITLVTAVSLPHTETIALSPSVMAAHTPSESHSAVNIGVHLVSQVLKKKAAFPVLEFFDRFGIIRSEIQVNSFLRFSQGHLNTFITPLSGAVSKNQTKYD